VPSFDGIPYPASILVVEDEVSLDMVIVIFILAAFENGDSYPRLASNIDKAVWLLFPDILVWVLLSMAIDYFNCYARACNLCIAA
jgi:hypothetical protein